MIRLWCLNDSSDARYFRVYPNLLHFLMVLLTWSDQERFGVKFIPKIFKD